MKQQISVKVNGWLACDEDGEYTLFSDKPIRAVTPKEEGFWFGTKIEERINELNLIKLTWDSEPVYVEAETILTYESN